MAQDACSGIQGDAEYLRRQVEDTIKQVRGELFFQREEDASAQALQDQCKGRKDASPQCQVIAADLEARTALRKQNEPKVQALMATLQYYRTEYDQANLDLYRCRDMVETEKQLKAAPDPDNPPVDPNQPTPDTADAGKPPPDPNQPDAPAKPEPGPPGPKPIDDPGSRMSNQPVPTPDPNTLERERNRIYQPPAIAALPPYDPGPDLRPPNNVGEPYARGPRARDRKIGSRLGVPSDTPVGPPLIGSDSEPDANKALIVGTCDWAAQQTDPAALSAREQKLHTIQSMGFVKKAAAESLVTSLTDKLNAETATLNADKAAKNRALTDAQQILVDSAQSRVWAAQRDLDRIKKDDFQNKLLPVAINCIVSRKASLAQPAKAAPPKPPSSGACTAENAQYQCVYMGAGAGVPLSMGSASGVASMVMSVCVPPSGFASATCSVDTIAPGAAATSDPTRTPCDPPKDQAAFAQQCKDLHGRLVTPTQQVAKAMPDVAPAPETAVGDPEKPAPPAPETAIGSPAKHEDPTPTPETAIGDPEKPKPSQPKTAAPEPPPVPPSAPHVNVVTLPDPPELGPPEFAPTPHVNVVTLPPPPEFGPPEMTPGPHVKSGTPTPGPSPASAQPHVNIYEKPARPTPPALAPPPGGSSAMNWGSCDKDHTTGPCAPSASTEPKADPAKAAPKPLPPEKVAAATPKIEPAAPAQKAQPKPLPPEKVAAATPHIEPAAPAQKQQPKALPPEKTATATPKAEPPAPAHKAEPKTQPPATAPHPTQANAPVQPAEPAKPAVKPSCTRTGFTFKTSQSESKAVTEKVVGGAACVHAYNANGVTFTGLSISAHPSNGTLTQVDATHFRYQVRAGFKGSDRYAVKVCATGKGGNGCSVLTYQVTSE